MFESIFMGLLFLGCAYLIIGIFMIFILDDYIFDGLQPNDGWGHVKAALYCVLFWLPSLIFIFILIETTKAVSKIDH